jgi:hypothetical protein
MHQALVVFHKLFPSKICLAAIAKNWGAFGRGLAAMCVILP